MSYSANLHTLPVVNWPLTADLKAWPLSFDRDPKALAQSIKELGLIQPLWGTLDEAGLPIIVSGGLRLSALRDLGYQEAPVRLFEAPKEELWPWVLADNLSRSFNPAEIARLWRAITLDLASLSPERAQTLKNSLAASLGLPKNPKIQAQYLLASQLPDKILLSLAREKLDLGAAARLAEMGQIGSNLWDLLEPNRPSLQSRKLWLEWLEDLARAENRSILEVAQEILNSKPSQNSKLEEPWDFGQRLRARRFPKIAQMELLRQKLLKALPLPSGSTLKLDPTFEDGSAEIRLTFATPEELLAQTQALGRLTEDPQFLDLWRLPWPE
ncbi:MAG: ParB/RepB/Spo0J family partition protein [Deltaproteobacteria bacterium]|nr:ParB/RepB/Spo0J family partition protein [Deltaproteobacteria bacterium]